MQNEQCHPVFQEILSKFEVKNCEASEANDKNSENKEEDKE